MLKKSLKIGSLLLLIFAMAAFVFVSCDSGSTDNEPDDTPVVVDPDKPDEPDPDEPTVETVTGVTITPPTEDILAGREYLLQAAVSGTASDKTVSWEVALADTDLSHDLEDGTFIVLYRGAGRLKIDGGQVPGTVLTITARSNADPSVSGSLTVTVMKPGPRLSWTPNQIPVKTAANGDITNDESLPASSIGRLLDIYGKDITISDAEYIEGQHYSVRRVDNLNQRIEGGSVTVTGNPDEGTITVELSGPLIGLKGPIGVTLHPEVFGGADASLIDLEGPGAELIFNVTSDLLITSLNSLTTMAKPVNGMVAATKADLAPIVPASVTNDITSDGKVKVAIAWTGLSANLYTHRNEAVAKVTLTAQGDYRFYPSAISESTVSAKFGGGSVSNYIPTDTKLSFTLTYKITAQTINLADLNNGAGEADDDYLGGLLIDSMIENFKVKHNEEPPAGLRVLKESLKYSLDRPVVWSGPGVNGKTFVGGKLAEAKITIPAKPGYTFDGTDITGLNLVSRIFPLGSPAGDIISVGDELVFTLTYNVKKGVITDAIIGANITTKLPVAVVGNTATNKDIVFNKLAPFTGSLSWSGVTSSKFVAGQNALAIITLQASDGYEFNPAIVNNTNITPGNIAIRGTIPNTTDVINTGTKLVIKVTETPIKFVESVAPGGPLSFEDGSLTHGETIVDVDITAGPQITGESTFAWVIPVSEGTIDYNATSDNRVYALLTLAPVDGYTFGGISITQDLKNLIATNYALLDKKPEVVAVTTDGENLVVDLKYQITKARLVPATVADDDFVSNFEGAAPTPGVAVSTVTAFPIVTPGGNVTLGTGTGLAPDWTAGTTTEDDIVVFEAEGEAVYTFYLIPNSGYQFVASDLLGDESWKISFESLFSLEDDGEADTVTPTITPEGNLKVEVSWSLDAEE
jgi:hypothetical protein